MGRFEEAKELSEDFMPEAIILISLMQGDLEAAQDDAEDVDNYPLLSMIAYLQRV